MNIRNYMQDGASWQPMAILSILRGNFWKVEQVGQYDHRTNEYFAKLQVMRVETEYIKGGYEFTLTYDNTPLMHFAVDSPKLDVIRITKYRYQKMSVAQCSQAEQFEVERFYDNDVNNAANWIINKCASIIREYEYMMGF